MPVRINLKELFGSDSQEITIDRLNFNFNKLLELGVGIKGDIGLTGGTGSIGPAGGKGLKGDKGNQWFVGTGDPNIQTFEGLMDEDFYIYNDNSQIWQYDLATDNWVVLVDLESIVTNYLTTAGSTFVRGLGTGSPDDSRFIVFPNRGNNLSDQSNDGIGAPSNNDIFFLNNFNEKFQDTVIEIGNFPTDEDELYNALQSIYVDYTSTIPGRYHLDFGSLYKDSNAEFGPVDEFVLTSLKHNLKIRHQVEDVGDVSEKKTLYKALFSLSTPENGYVATDLDYHALFEFVSPKYNVAAPIVNSEFTAQLGSQYSHLVAAGGVTSYVEFDGFNFKSQGNTQGGIGISYDLTHLLDNIDGTHQLMLDVDGTNATSILLNNDTLQDGGNIRQLGTSEFREITTENGYPFYSPPEGPESFASSGMYVSGNILYSVSGFTNVSTTSEMDLSGSPLITYLGNANMWDISDKNEVKLIYPASTWTISDIGGTDYLFGVGLCDIEAAGNLVYLVTNATISSYKGQEGVGVSYLQQYLQIAEVKPNGAFWDNVIGKIGVTDPDMDGNSTTEETVSGTRHEYLDGAWRLKLHGQYAIIATNKLRQFGHASTNNALSHWGTTLTDPVSGFKLGMGYISAVNISVPDQLTIGSTSFVEEQSIHHLDMDLSDDFIATIAIKVGEDVGGTHWNGHTVQVRAYDIESKNDDNLNITLDADGTYDIETNINSPSTDLTNANSQDHTVINKFGAIAIDGKRIYALYKNNIWIFTRYESGTGLTLFEFKSSTNLPSVGSNARMLSCKIVGRSIYALVSEGGSSSYDSNNSYLLKANIDSEGTVKEIWYKDLGNALYDCFEISGNNAYIGRADTANGGEIKIVEIDGIETEALNVGEVKADEVNVTKNLKVNRNISGNGINIGTGGVVSEGPISAGGRFSGYGVVYKNDTDNTWIKFEAAASSPNKTYQLPTNNAGTGLFLTSTAGGQMSWSSEAALRTDFTPGWSRISDTDIINPFPNPATSNFYTEKSTSAGAWNIAHNATSTNVRYKRIADSGTVLHVNIYIVGSTISNSLAREARIKLPYTIQDNIGEVYSNDLWSDLNTLYSDTYYIKGIQNTNYISIIDRNAGAFPGVLQWTLKGNITLPIKSV